MNEKIRAAREIALSILKPSEKELERGLELHSSSLVFDAYGFSPRVPINGDILRETAESGASNWELKDLHEEMIMTGHLRDANARKECEEAWQEAGVTCIFQNAGEECSSPLQMLKRFARFTHCADMHRAFLSRASLPEDILKAKADGRHCIYMTTNGIPLAQEWHSVEEELGFIRLFFQLGCRMMHMTYNRRNMLGDGCMEASNAGLSDFGRAAIKELNRLGIICDLAHSGWRTSLEAARISSRPVVSSHSGCNALSQHPRNKPDEVIKAIADSGGYNGICCISDFLGGSKDISSFLDHIDYMIKHFGADHVAIGTDKAYSSPRAEGEWAKLGNSYPKSRRIFESFWPPGSLPDSDHPSLAWTNWPLFTVGLVQRGYSDDDIKKVIGGNVLRVARAALEGIVI